MTLGERIRTVLDECGLTQVEFARATGISANYISLLANDKKETISETLAILIRELYGYSDSWILRGEGVKCAKKDVSPQKLETMRRVKNMAESEAKATLAFVKVVEDIIFVPD